MSKLSPLGQSAAALFTPEGERLRSAQEKKTSGANQPVRIPGAKSQVGQGQKSQDSLGDSATPGYEFFGRKKKTPEEQKKEEANPHSVETISVPQERENVIRLQVGWEKLLLAQKKICEKAKGLLLAMEAPMLYASARKGKGLQLKSRGCILDLDASNSVPEMANADEIAKDQKKIA